MNIKEIIDTYDNIFDIYIVLFELIKTNESKILIKAETNIQSLCYMMKEIDLTLRNKQFKYTMSPQNKIELKEIISNLCNVDYELCEFALFSEIDEVFGNMEYRFERNFEFDDFDLDNIENDGNKVQDLRIFNTERTISSIGSVFYKKDSIFNKFLEGSDYPRSDDEKTLSLERYQTNLIVIPKILSQIKIKYLNICCEYTVTRLKKKKSNLKIAMVPFVSSLNYLNTYNEKQFFYIKGIEDEEASIEHLNELMNILNKNKVDIVVFPEMIFTTNMEKWLEKYLKNNETSFILVIAGSKWENNSNRCKIYNGNGIILNEQIKINPYIKSNNKSALGNIEGIEVKSEEAELKILDVETLGRISTPICVDFTITDYFELLMDSGVNVSFNPVCTGSLSDFHRNAERLGSANRGVAFISNSCMHQKKEEIGFVYIPIKLNEKINIAKDELSFKRCYNLMGSKCKCLDKTCYFLIEFSNKYCRTETIRI